MRRRRREGGRGRVKRRRREGGREEGLEGGASLPCAVQVLSPGLSAGRREKGRYRLRGPVVVREIVDASIRGHS